MTHKFKVQKVQRSDLDELHWQDRFEEIEVDAGTPLVDTTQKGPISVPFRKSNPSRRELVWRFQRNEMVSLEEIALQFQSFLLTFSTELEFNRCRGRYTTQTAHRCPGYNRIEITLTPDIARSAIVSHLTPIPHEICPVCKEIVKDAEIFACICGRDGKPAPHVHDHSSCLLTSLVDNESIPTIKCLTCSEWHHRPCASISNDNDQSFVCQRCKVQTEDLICPSPVLASRRRKGWFNRRGYVFYFIFLICIIDMSIMIILIILSSDQLWTNSGMFYPALAGEQYPPEFDNYPEYGDGWMNEKNVRIDMKHWLISKAPPSLLSTLK